MYKGIHITFIQSLDEVSLNLNHCFDSVLTKLSNFQLGSTGFVMLKAML